MPAHARWIERQEMRERELAKACAREEFDELVAQFPVTLTLGKSAEDESITLVGREKGAREAAAEPQVVEGGRAQLAEVEGRSS